MQNRFREKRSTRRSRRSREKETTSFWKLILTLLPFLFVGCSTTNKDASPFEILKPICLNSEGKGRVTLGRSKNVFDYETAFARDKSYALSMDIPVHGEEWFQLDLNKKKVKGSFVSHLNKNASPYHKAQLSRFFDMLSELVGYLDEIGKHRAKDCKLVAKTKSSKIYHCAKFKITQTQKMIELDFNFKSTDSLKLVLSALGDYYERMTWSYNSDRSTSNLKFEMFPNGCNVTPNADAR